MNKSELIDAMAKEAGMTKKDIEISLNAFITTVQKAVKGKDKVSLVGFGTFEQRQRAARKGVNPKTKEAINIPASKAPVFKAGKSFKEIVNGKTAAKTSAKPATKKK